jgi:hypothetical protein
MSLKFRIQCYLLLLVVLLMVCIAQVFSGEMEEILKRPDVVKSVTALKHDAFDSKLFPYETVLEVLPDSTEFYSGPGLHIQLPPAPKDLIAIIHCHPDAAYPKPSDDDIQTAKTLHVPVFTISRNTIWMTTPDGTSHEVKQ